MKPIHALIFPAALLFFSCGNKAAAPENKTDTTRVSSLSGPDVYAFDKVAAYIKGASEDQKVEAKKQFLEGIDLYRNNNRPADALQPFRNSLSIYPASKTYYELGNALLDMGNYDEALNAYHMAERMDYSPLSKVLYNLACTYSLMENEDEALRYVQLSIENGYENRAHMLKDEDLAFVRKSERFNEVYEASTSGSGSPGGAMLELFAANFSIVALPYGISAEASQKLEMNMDHSIGYDFERFIPEMENGDFSRDVGDEFFYIAHLKETPKFMLLLYAGEGMMEEDSPVYYKLATYDRSTGARIDGLDFAGMEYFDSPLRSGSVRSDLSVEVQHYTAIYEKNPDDFGYAGNKIVKKELYGTDTYRITADGKFVEARPVLGGLTR